MAEQTTTSIVIPLVASTFPMRQDTKFEDTDAHMLTPVRSRPPPEAPDSTPLPLRDIKTEFMAVSPFAPNKREKTDAETPDTAPRVPIQMPSLFTAFIDDICADKFVNKWLPPDVVSLLLQHSAWAGERTSKAATKSARTMLQTHVEHPASTLNDPTSGHIYFLDTPSGLKSSCLNFSLLKKTPGGGGRRAPSPVDGSMEYSWRMADGKGHTYKNNVHYLQYHCYIRVDTQTAESKRPEAISRRGPKHRHDLALWGCMRVFVVVTNPSRVLVQLFGMEHWPRRTHNKRSKPELSTPEASTSMTHSAAAGTPTGSVGGSQSSAASMDSTDVRDGRHLSCPSPIKRGRQTPTNVGAGGGNVQEYGDMQTAVAQAMQKPASSSQVDNEVSGILGCVTPKPIKQQPTRRRQSTTKSRDGGGKGKGSGGGRGRGRNTSTSSSAATTMLTESSSASGFSSTKGSTKGILPSSNPLPIPSSRSLSWTASTSSDDADTSMSEVGLGAALSLTTELWSSSPDLEVHTVPLCMQSLQFPSPSEHESAIDTSAMDTGVRRLSTGSLGWHTGATPVEGLSTPVSRRPSLGESSSTSGMSMTPSNSMRPMSAPAAHRSTARPPKSPSSTILMSPAQVDRTRPDPSKPTQRVLFNSPPNRGATPVLMSGIVLQPFQHENFRLTDRAMGEQGNGALPHGLLSHTLPSSTASMHAPLPNRTDTLASQTMGDQPQHADAVIPLTEHATTHQPSSLSPISDTDTSASNNREEPIQPFTTSSADPVMDLLGDDSSAPSEFDMHMEPFPAMGASDRDVDGEDAWMMSTLFEAQQ